VTIEPNTIKAIQLAWPDLIAGKGGVEVQSPLGLGDVDPTLLTPGRLRLAQETLDGLLAGRISPLLRSYEIKQNLRKGTARRLVARQSTTSVNRQKRFAGQAKSV